jgi:hypothetical protein
MDGLLVVVTIGLLVVVIMEKIGRRKEEDGLRFLRTKFSSFRNKNETKRKIAINKRTKITPEKNPCCCGDEIHGLFMFIYKIFLNFHQYFINIF